jgi:hypothetical protein
MTCRARKLGAALDLHSSRAAWTWMTLGCCCCQSCTGSCASLPTGKNSASHPKPRATSPLTGQELTQRHGAGRIGHIPQSHGPVAAAAGKVRPSGLNTTESTKLVWPVLSAEGMFHSRAVWSLLPLAECAHQD